MTNVWPSSPTLLLPALGASHRDRCTSLLLFEQTLIHLIQLKEVSYEAFPGKSSLPYFSDGIYCCYFCLLTVLNLHLDHAMFHPRVTIPLPVSLLDYEVLEGIETRFSSSLSPQSPAWDCYKACCSVSAFLMNYSMNRLGKTRLTPLLVPLICFFFCNS